MANYQTLKSAIQDVVKTNGNNEITGALLQQSLLAMISSLGQGYQFVGIAEPTTNPGTPDAKVFYLAGQNGTYPYFSGLSLNDGEIAILTFDTQWHKLSNNFVSKQMLGAAISEIEPINNYGTINNAPDEEDITTNPQNLLQFKDRSTLNGLGYVILRMDKTFSEQVTKQDTIYEVRYNFDLGGNTIVIPQNSILQFNGGILSNGTLKGQNTKITAPVCKIFNGIDTDGTWNIPQIYPEWFGTKNNITDDDSAAIQDAINMSNLNGCGCCVLSSFYRINNTLNNIKHLLFNGGELALYNDITAIQITGDYRVVDGNGKIAVYISSYTQNIIEFLGASQTCKINGIKLYGYRYDAVGGTGIKFITTGGRHFGHNINVDLRNLTIGIDIDSSKNWANNFTFNILTAYCSKTVNIHGSNESSGHYGVIKGQAGHNVTGGCVVYDEDTIGSFWDINVFDTGVSAYNKTLLNIRSGYAKIPKSDIAHNTHLGNWTSNWTPNIYLPEMSCVKNCDAKTWIIKEPIGNAALLTNPVTAIGMGFKAASDAIASGVNSDNDGIKITFNFPHPIYLGVISMFISTNNAPKIIKITATGASGTESVIIDKFAFENGKTINSEELFTYRSRFNCTSLSVEFMGTLSGTYTRCRYIGIQDMYGQDFVNE